MKGQIKSAPGLLLSALKSVSGPVNCVNIQCAKSTLHLAVTTDLASLMSRPVYSELCVSLVYLFIWHSCDTFLRVCCNCAVTDRKLSCRLLQQCEVQQSLKQLCQPMYSVGMYLSPRFIPRV